MHCTLYIVQYAVYIMYNIQFSFQNNVQCRVYCKQVTCVQCTVRSAFSYYAITTITDIHRCWRGMDIQHLSSYLTIHVECYLHLLLLNISL